MARLRAESAAGGRWIPATRAGGPSALRLLLLLGAVRKPQESVAQLFTTPGVLESERKMNEEYRDRIEDCWENYTDYMDSIKGDWCNWAIISRPYSFLQNCLEENAERFHLGFPNSMAEHFIFQTHQIHFANCSLVQPTLSDPPEDVLLAMIIAPICLIPFLVTLVVWRSKDNETQA
ncbi:receptor activity-modifying protein 2 isoform X5 [Phyllostomus discolor]|uniref:Receptor activity-modifying protein 2 n=1 Tax=Phyllostomus discolor TaxID=89673 RepID=A0A7E6EFS6_9CHIR|nr:receptor activity-modifying protein 2 isoform X5 [Phyllostomus discolor]